MNSMTTESVSNDVVKDLVELTHARLAPEEAEQVATFLRALYSGPTALDLFGERIEHLYAAAVSLSRFMRERKEHEVKVRIFNPTIDEQGYSSSHTVIEVVQPDMPFLVDSVSAELMRWVSIFEVSYARYCASKERPRATPTPWTWRTL